MSFDKQLALECAGLIQQVYQRSFEPTISVPATDTQVHVAERAPGEFWVIFPGTSSVHDGITDLKVRKTAWGDVRAHRGFVDAFRSVATVILPRLQSAKRIIITGHSLGGALGTLCAESCVTAGFPVVAVYTFGSPRVGNGPFARLYNSKLSHHTYRVVNARDPVPHVPWLLGTYRHVDTQVYLRRDGTAQIDEPLQVHAAELIEAARDAKAGFDGAPQFITISAHGINSYITKLKSLA